MKVGEHVIAPKTSCARPYFIDGMYIYICRWEGITTVISPDVTFQSSWEKPRDDHDEKKLHQLDTIIGKKPASHKLAGVIKPYSETYDKVKYKSLLDK